MLHCLPSRLPWLRQGLQDTCTAFEQNNETAYNEDTVARAMAGEDVQLTYAMLWLDKQQAPVAATTTPA
ncbi:MAG: hypothetical protein PHT99_03330 [Methanoregula sp.]|nr:hypothetical protein [Methanoregula sp.]